jgi:nucleoid-associated protein YgaU
MAGPNVRESVASPTSAQGAAAAASAAPAGVAAPGQPVLTQQEIVPAPQQAAQRPPVQTIQVGPGPVQAQPPITIQQFGQAPLAQQPPTGLQPQWQPPAQTPVTTAAGQRRGPTHPLQNVAGQHGEEVVVVGEPSGLSPTGNGTATNPPVPMAPLRQYKAQAGDSLSKLASRFLGANTRTNREAIIRANATLQENPDKIVEGRTYLIPVPSTASAPAAPAPVAIAPAPVAVPAAAPTAPAAPAEGTFSWYTVKENDNLWRIAADQLGTGTAAKQIKELNGDVLKGNDNLQVGMRLRIPPKPVASAN